MKKSVTQTQVIIMTSLAALVVLAGWSHARLAEARRTALTAEEDLTECQALAVAIEELRQKPLLAATEVHSDTELIGQIGQAGMDAKLPKNSLMQITPESSHRLGDSSYQLQPTRVALEGVSLEQLLRFLSILTSDEEGRDISEINMIPTRNRGSGHSEKEIWSVDVVLTRLIFSPKRSVHK